MSRLPTITTGTVLLEDGGRDQRPASWEVAVTDHTIDRGLGVRDRMDLLAAVIAALLDAVQRPVGSQVTSWQLL
jgi:hypothetical protein